MISSLNKFHRSFLCSVILNCSYFQEIDDRDGGFGDRTGLLEDTVTSPRVLTSPALGHARPAAGHLMGHHHSSSGHNLHPGDRLGDAALNGSPRVTFRTPHHETEF